MIFVTRLIRAVFVACIVTQPLVAGTVTQTTDDGTGAAGTLSAAITNATPGEIITIALPAGSTITVTGQLPAITKPMAIVTSSPCGPNGPTISILGSGGAAASRGLLIGMNVQLYGLWVRGFSRQIVVPAGGRTIARCVRATKF